MAGGSTGGPGAARPRAGPRVIASVIVAVDDPQKKESLRG
jgi:hypothetical protein